MILAREKGIQCILVESDSSEAVELINAINSSTHPLVNTKDSLVGS